MMSLTPIPPPFRCMLPGWISAFAMINVPGPVTLPTLRLADAILAVMIAPGCRYSPESQFAGGSSMKGLVGSGERKGDEQALRLLRGRPDGTAHPWPVKREHGTLIVD